MRIFNTILQRRQVNYGSLKAWWNGCGWELAVLLLAAVLLALLATGRLPWLSEWQCPLLALTGRPCLTCGMTRALTALCDGCWREAFHHHPLAWLLPVGLCLRLGQRLAETIGKSYVDFRHPLPVWLGAAAMALLFGLFRMLLWHS